MGLQHEARVANLTINVGIHEPTSDSKGVKNTLNWIDSQGDIVQGYQQLYLFVVDVDGGPELNESRYVRVWLVYQKLGTRNNRSVEGGRSILTPLETAVGRVGLAICFDVCRLAIFMVLKESLSISVVSRAESRGTRCGSQISVLR